MIIGTGGGSQELSFGDRESREVNLTVSWLTASLNYHVSEDIRVYLDSRFRGDDRLCYVIIILSILLAFAPETNSSSNLTNSVQRDSTMGKSIELSRYFKSHKYVQVMLFGILFSIVILNCGAYAKEQQAMSLRLGGCGGVYFYAPAGELWIEVEKQDLNITVSG